MTNDGSDWGLPGTRFSRRTRLYGTAARVGARYATLRLPGAPRGEKRARGVEAAHRRGARDLFDAAVELRGGFLKMGQFVSSRPDLLPEAYVEQLSKLQDRVPPAPAAVIERIVAETIGPIEEHFAEFDRHEASAASLAQVHRAVRRDGRVVAVKVQYPRVREIVPTEMRETRRILEAVSKVVSGIGLPTIAAALERSVLDELDYHHEAANIERFADNFAGEPGIVIPRVHHDLSSDRVLVMDWIDGENLARSLRTADRDVADEALRLLVDSYMKQILVDGFLHADPHPGNFLLQVTDGGPRLGIVDFGSCAPLSDEARLALREAYRAGAEVDIEAVVHALHRLGLRTRSGDARSLLAWASLFTSDPSLDATRQKAWRRLVGAARSDPVTHIPPELVMLGRVLIVQSGLLRDHQPSWEVDDLVLARLGLEPRTASPVSIGATSGGAGEAFDPTDPDFIADPYPRYRELRESSHLHRGMFGAPVLTRHADVHAALLDERLSSDPRHMDASVRRGLEHVAPVFSDEAPGILLFLDPPDHTRLRRLVSKAFTPRAVEQLRPHVADLVAGMLDAAARDGATHDGASFDLMATLAEPLPVVVICELLGVPATDHADFKQWSTAIAGMLDPILDPNRLRRAIPAVLGMVSYFNELLAERADDPRDDLLSALLAAEAEGDRLDHGELIALVILLFIAGHETTTNLIGNGTLALLRNPDQYQRLVEDPALARPAVEELLRYDAPVQMTARTATADVEVNGLELAAGQTVLLGIAAANRDDRVWPDADRLLIAREGPPPLSFGYGIHYCLGAGLARLEGQEVFAALARRFPDLTLVDERPPYREHFVLRGLTRLEVATRG